MISPQEHNAPARVVELRNVCKTYGSEPAVHSLGECEFDARTREWLAITGPSGAGKSTLLHILVVPRPSNDRHFPARWYRYIEPFRRPARRCAQPATGLCLQSFHLLPYRTVLENVMLAEVYCKLPVQDRESRLAQQSSAWALSIAPSSCK